MIQTTEAFTPDELEAAANELDREAAAERQARILARAEQRRSQQLAQQERAARAAILWAADQPSSGDDALILGHGVGELAGVRFRGGQLSHWVSREQGEAIVRAAQAGQLVRQRAALFGRELLICKRLPDLRATIAAAFADDATHGERPAYAGGSDGGRIDQMVRTIVGEVTHAPTLLGWADAASDDNDRELIAQRLESLRLTGRLREVA